MKINGVNWSIGGFGTLVEARYYESEDNLLVIDATDSKKNQKLTIIANEITSQGDYRIGYRNTDSIMVDSTVYVIEDNFNGAYSLKDEFESRLTITNFDLNKKIVSGIFYMKMINKHGEILSITEGRFDIDLTLVQLSF